MSTGEEAVAAHYEFHHEVGLCEDCFDSIGVRSYVYNREEIKCWVCGSPTTLRIDVKVLLVKLVLDYINHKKEAKNG